MEVVILDIKRGGSRLSRSQRAVAELMGFFDYDAHLDALRACGARYLVIPATGLWWLDHYGELAQWLAGRGETVAEEPGTGVVFGLYPQRE